MDKLEKLFIPKKPFTLDPALSSTPKFFNISYIFKYLEHNLQYILKIIIEAKIPIAPITLLSRPWKRFL